MQAPEHNHLEMPPPSEHDFYGGGLSEEDRRLLQEARRMDGLDDEIAVLRVQLRKAINEKEVDYRLLLRSVEALVRAVTAQHRLSPRARRDLRANIEAVMKDLSDQLAPTDPTGRIF
jgi:hypothetical protein